MQFKNLSASSIDGFTVCPRRQYLTMTATERNRVPQGFLIVGNAAHEALRMYHTELDDQRDIVEMFKDEIKSRGFVSFPVFASAAEFMKEYEKNYPRKQNVVFTEKSFLMEMGGYPVRGFIDRVDYLGDGTYEVVDYKTSWVAKTADDLKEDIQLITYDIALRHMAESGELVLPAPVKRVIVSLHYLRHDKVSAEYTDEQRESYKQYVTLVGDTISAIEEEPQPKLNNFCRYCDFADSCTLYHSDFAEAFRAEVTKDIGELAAELEGVRKIIKMAYGRKDKIEEILMEDLNREAAPEKIVDGYRLAMASKTYRRYDAEKLVKVLPNSFQKYISVSTREASKATGIEKDALDSIVQTYKSKAYVEVKRVKAAKDKRRDL